MKRYLQAPLGIIVSGVCCCLLMGGPIDRPPQEEGEAPPAFVETLDPGADALGRSLSNLHGKAFSNAYREHGQQIVRAQQRAGQFRSPESQLAVDGR